MIGFIIIIMLGVLAVMWMRGSGAEFFKACGCFFFGIFVVFALLFAVAIMAA